MQSEGHLIRGTTASGDSTFLTVSKIPKAAQGHKGGHQEFSSAPSKEIRKKCFEQLNSDEERGDPGPSFSHSAGAPEGEL